MERTEFLERINQSDRVLVGLGEDFDDRERLKQDDVWKRGRELLQEAKGYWLLPAWNEYCSGRLGEDVVTLALERLSGILENKNYFVVAVCTNEAVNRLMGNRQRIVMPCGGTWKKQCSNNCAGELYPVDQRDRAALDVFFEKLHRGEAGEGNALPSLGRCGQCGADLVLNNIFADKYNETGYLDDWGMYTKWLQGTLNHSLFVLELGVRMNFPSVIRWPFERIVRYNKKAFLCRVNQDLYQMPEDLSTKGYGISKNTIDWLRRL